jgi:CubicO group peptidase (beta-lactamase class C family)
MLNAADWTTRLNELATEANVPGAALGIWSDGQEILAAHGVLNAATQAPVTTDSVFQVGSITKIWTATMIMQLVDEGLLSLDTTVSEVLPGARLGAADVGGQVTVRHLLTHTSGIDGDIFTDTGRAPVPRLARWPGWTGPPLRRISNGTPVTTSGRRGGSTCRCATAGSRWRRP